MQTYGGTPYLVPSSLAYVGSIQGQSAIMNKISRYQHSRLRESSPWASLGLSSLHAVMGKAEFDLIMCPDTVQSNADTPAGPTIFKLSENMALEKTSRGIHRWPGCSSFALRPSAVMISSKRQQWCPDSYTLQRSFASQGDGTYGAERPQKSPAKENGMTTLIVRGLRGPGDWMTDDGCNGNYLGAVEEYMNAVDSEVTINLNVVFVQENYQEEAVQRMLNDGEPVGEEWEMSEVQPQRRRYVEANRVKKNRNRWEDGQRSSENKKETKKGAVISSLEQARRQMIGRISCAGSTWHKRRALLGTEYPSLQVSHNTLMKDNDRIR
ncbi:hypothetical protein EDD18DRAFT_1099810 [Armillaria luteobubalina]|uniref:Uncharacterized protein n=1 Tax=Armillaria luteobubalina TaxID=153913 RepID=A0AA39QJI6_9AGAR|nr:hypothetical protein EDD18DRAFT_1099810 [Armillaria luteobubalina]